MAAISFTHRSGNEKKALLYSTLIFTILLLLLFLWRISYKNTGNEGGGGIEIDFGNSEFGLGEDNTSLGAPASGDNLAETFVPETPVTEPTVKPVTPIAPPATKPTTNSEQLSSTNADAIAIRKKQEAEAAAAAEKARLEAQKREAERIRKEQEEFERKMKGGMSGINQGSGTGGTGTGDGQGNTKPGGNQGDLSGIDGGTGTGGSGGGTGGGHGTGAGPGSGPGKGGNISHTLTNRSIISKPDIVNKQSALGKVVIRVKVDRNGIVTDATYVSQGSTTNDKYLIELSQTAARKIKFSASGSGSEEQFGTITFNYTQ